MFVVKKLLMHVTMSLQTQDLSPKAGAFYSRGWSMLVGVRNFEPPHLNKLSPFTFPNARSRIWSGTHSCMIAKFFRSGLLFCRIREGRHKVVYFFNVFRVEAIAFRSDITIPRIDPTLPTASIIVESTTLFFYQIDYGHNLGQVAWATTFCSVAPNICGSSEWNLPHVILLASRICRWFLDFWKICVRKCKRAEFI